MLTPVETIPFDNDSARAGLEVRPSRPITTVFIFFTLASEPIARPISKTISFVNVFSAIPLIS